MSITWLGIVLIPLGTLIFLLAPRWLYSITVFSIPFTATSLLNTTSGVPLPPLQFFGMLYIVHQLLEILSGRRELLPLFGDRSIFLIIFFLAVVLISMSMPLIIDGSLWVSSNRINDLYDTPLRLTWQNFKNPLPVVFGFVLSILFVFQNSTLEKLQSTIKLYVLSGAIVSLWGYFQFLCNNLLNIEYPYVLFNNAVADSMKGYEQVLELGDGYLTRTSSVTHEPSIFAKYLLTVVPIVLVAVLLRRPLFGIKRDKFLLWMFVGMIILTTSTIGLLGVLGALALTEIILNRVRPVDWTWVIRLAFVSLLSAFAYFSSESLKEMLDTFVIFKLDSGSAIERSLSIANSWKYFTSYPILGVGWAMVTSHDLIVYLLVNTGMVGLVSFSVLIYYLVRRSLQSLGKCSSHSNEIRTDVSALIAALLISLILLIMTGIATGLEFYLGYFYFIMGVLIAANIVCRVQSRGTLQ